jgi:hypothetical protein
MCLATGANFEFWFDCLVRTNSTSCIMLKVVKNLNLNPCLFYLLSKEILLVCFFIA